MINVINLQRLPPLTINGKTIYLPISCHSCWGILEAIIEPELGARAEKLSSTIAESAPLALWAICVCNLKEKRSLVTIAQVTDWLLGSGMEKYLACGQPQEGPEHLSMAEGHIARWQRLSSASRLAYQFILAEDPRQFTSEDDRAQTLLLALLHNANDWMEAGRTEGASEQGKRILPSWLVSALRRVRSADKDPTDKDKDGNSTSIRLLRRVIERVDSEQPGQPLEASAEGWTTGVSSGTETARGSNRWFRLVERVTKLRDLELNFFRRLETEKLASMKELAYGAGHEINNPLANISSRAQTLLREESDPERRRKLATINSQAFRAHEMIADMMLFAKPSRPEPRELKLSEIVVEVINETQPMAQQQKTNLVASGGISHLNGLVRADPVLLKVALKAICKNALEALGAGGHVQVDWEIVARDGQALAIVAVHDNGPGISELARRHLFDPFYSGREAGRGLGFGLAKAWRIVQEHSGTIDVESQPGHGAKVTVQLPAVFQASTTDW